MRGFTDEQLQATYPEEMSNERLIQLVDEAAKMGVYEFAFVGGGDPMARPITFELIKRIRSLGMHGDLVTNGTLFQPGQIEELVRIQWDRIKYSVDGASPEVYDHIRGLKGGFKRLHANLRKTQALKEKHGSKFPRVAFNVVVSNLNYTHFLDIVELATEVGCEEILVLPMTIFSDTGSELKMNMKETRAYQDQIREGMKMIKRAGIYSNMHEFLDTRLISETNDMDKVMLDEAKTKEELAQGDTNSDQSQLMQLFKNPEENFQHLPCYMPWHHVTVIANGNIAPCFNGYVWETKTSLKNHSLAEVWYGEYFDGFRRQLETRKLWDTCATCCVWRVFENRDIRQNMQERGSTGKRSEKDEQFRREVEQHTRISRIMRSLLRKTPIAPLITSIGSK